MKAHHDKIINRLVKAIPDRLGTKYLHQCVPDCEGLLRPDIMILNSESSDTAKKACLVDVAVPCETGDNLKVSHDRKRERYSDIWAKLEERGYETFRQFHHWNPRDLGQFCSQAIGNRSQVCALVQETLLP